MEIRLLGSGGFIPTDRRDTACALLRRGEAALAIDAGSGARRLVTERELLDGVERLHVVLTHFHLDHCHGLFYLVDARVPVGLGCRRGAGGRFDGHPARPLLGPPFAPGGFLDRFTIRELGVGTTQVGPFSVSTRVQPLHSNPTLALRIEDEIAWCTDTGYDEDNVAFARGVRVLFHEAFHAGDASPDRSHTASGEAARLAAAAAVGRLVLIHLEAAVDDDELLRWARPHFPATDVAADGAALVSPHARESPGRTKA